MPALRRLLILLLVFSPVLAHAQAYTSIVIIGDSLSDTGNDTHVSTAKYGPGAALPAPVTGYTNGRFTDGIDTIPPASLYKGVWIEQLAAMLAAKPTVIDSLDGGANYAYGFAFTGPGTSNFTYGPGDALSFPIDNMGLQLSTYLATNPTITSKTLFVVWGGANDLLNATSPTDISNAVTNELAIVQTLISAGATDFIIPNLPPLGSIPELKGDPADAKQLTMATVGFNQALALNLAALPAANPGKTLHLFPLDVFGLFNSVIATPSTYDLTNVTDSSQFAAVDPDTYLFWDGLHPTTAGHHQLALAALALITPATTTTALTASTSSADLGAPVTFTATVSSSSGTPTGVVTFYDGTTAIGTAQLNGASPDVATFTTTSLTAGSHTITAVYTASQYFNASTSSAVTEAVTAPAISPSITPVGLTIARGSSGTVTLTVATVGGFSGTVGLSCGTLAAPITCAFSQNSLVFTGGDNTLTSTLTVNTAGSDVSHLVPSRTRSSAALEGIATCALLPLFGFLALRRTPRSRVVLLGLLMLLSLGATLGLSGCGSDSSGAHTGNYTVPVNFSTGVGTSTVSFMVTVTR